MWSATQTSPIYRWRGADIQNILNFEKDYPEAVTIRLEQNYRSTGNILNAANTVILNNLGRKDKKLWTDQGPGKKVCYHLTEDERAEALFIAEMVFFLCKEDGLKFNDFAVLYRTHAQSRAIEEACIKYKLPYRIFGGTKFYERKEIKDTMSYLKVISNPDDSLSLARVINEPKRGIGSTTLEKVEDVANAREMRILAVMGAPELVPGLSPRFAGLLKGFHDLLANLISQKDQLTLSQLVRQIWEQTGYEKALLEDKSPEAENRLENLKEFLSVTEDFDRTAEEPTLENFLAQISLATDLDNLVEEDEKITMMTLHSAKGLEFPVVFLVGLEEGVFPHGPGDAGQRRDGRGAPPLLCGNDPGDEPALPDPGLSADALGTDPVQSGIPFHQGDFPGPAHRSAGWLRTDGQSGAGGPAQSQKPGPPAPAQR